MNVNFDEIMRKKLETYAVSGYRPRVLLHVCCAPCLSSVIERLEDFAEISLFYYNPNIYPYAEYEKRREQIYRFMKFTGKIFPVIRSDYDPGAFYAISRGLENEPESGERCRRCFSLRLVETAKTAAAGKYDLFTSTLSVSPHKNVFTLNNEGETAGKIHGAAFLPADFKKRDGYLRSVKLSEEFGLYRQNYCGCVYSMRENK